MGTQSRASQSPQKAPTESHRAADADTGTDHASGVTPQPGQIWETPHGVKMRMPKTGAGFSYIRLDYTLAGKRCQRSVGKDWQRAWLEANRVDSLVAADTGDTETLTVASLASAWTTACSPDWSAQYAADNATTLAKDVLPVIGSVQLGDLNRSHARACIANQQSKSGRKRVRALLSSMYGWGIDEQWLSKDLRAILPPAGKDAQGNRLSYRRRESAPTPRNALALAHQATLPRTYSSKHARSAFTPPPEDALIVLVAAFCGLRLSECFGLLGKDVQGDHVSVVRQARWVGNDLVISAPKGGKSRHVWVPEQVGDFELRDLLTSRAREVGKDGLMFPTRSGEHWKRRNFYRDVFAYPRSVAWKDKPWTFHDLRHTFCRWHLDAGVPIGDVSVMAGHSGVDVTMRLYVSANEGVSDRVSAAHSKGRR